MELVNLVCWMMEIIGLIREGSVGDRVILVVLFGMELVDLEYWMIVIGLISEGSSGGGFMLVVEMIR